MANFTKSASLRYSLPSWSPLEAIIFPGTHSFIKVSPFLQGWKTMSFFPKKKWGTLGISFFGTGGEWSWILYVPLYGGQIILPTQRHSLYHDSKCLNGTNGFGGGDSEGVTMVAHSSSNGVAMSSGSVPCKLLGGQTLTLPVLWEKRVACF